MSLSPKAKWVGAIVGLLVGNMLATSLLIGFAHAGQSQVIPHYYERAVHYDDAIDQAARNDQLGWHVTATWNGSLKADVTDRDGKSLQGAHVLVTSQPRSPHQVGGLHDVTIVVERKTDRFVSHQVVEAR